MSSRNVAIRKDVYDALHREKRPQESFTKLFLRLLSQRAPLEQVVGSWAGLDRRRAHRIVRSLREGALRRGP
ncbi:MAG: antitoxin VapB family protein [Thermoplasmata archaeon]|nr:antitoxin VapB family protein [Thermoplasmata archaeon]